MPKTPKSARNLHKPTKPYQSKHHLRSVECPPKPDHRSKRQLPSSSAKVVAEALRNLLVAAKSIQAVMKSEGRKWQLVSDSHPNMAAVHKIEALLQEALSMGEAVLVNYMGEKPTIPLFTELPKHRAYMDYEEGVG